VAGIDPSVAGMTELLIRTDGLSRDFKFHVLPDG
jgi:hypothetical protein